MRIKKVCEHCNSPYVARRTTTRFCSDYCAKANYKKRQRDSKINDTIDAAKEKMKEVLTPIEQPKVQSSALVQVDLLGIKELATVTSLSVRTLYRLMKEKDFPRLKIHGRLLFKKNDVINYLTLKYGNV